MRRSLRALSIRSAMARELPCKSAPVHSPCTHRAPIRMQHLSERLTGMQRGSRVQSANVARDNAEHMHLGANQEKLWPRLAPLSSPGLPRLANSLGGAILPPLQAAWCYQLQTRGFHCECIFLAGLYLLQSWRCLISIHFHPGSLRHLGVGVSIACPTPAKSTSQNDFATRQFSL